MNFLADENIDSPIVARLRKDGHTVSYVVEMEAGMPDDRVLQKAGHESLILLTADKDFGEMVFRKEFFHQGVILLRLAGLSLEKKSEIVSLAVQKYSKAFSQNFSVITPSAVRIRKKI